MLSILYRHARRIAVAGFALAALSLPALADEAAQATARRNIEAGSFAAGDAELSATVAADPSNNDARMGLGAIRFLAAVEHLTQGLYKYGLSSPRSFIVPILRLPAPPNPNPQQMTYADFRNLLLRFVDDLTSAESAFRAMDASEARLPVDLLKIRYDANGDGRVDDGERFAAVIARVTGTSVGDVDAPPVVVGFDRGDAYWLQGYCNVLLAFSNFLLAYDWQQSFDDSFHIFFPNVASVFSRELSATGSEISQDRIVDLISFIHIPWRVAEPERMRKVREHLKTVVALSRKSWDAIEAETDDNAEWIPNPKQTQSVTGLGVSAEQLASWRAFLDEADALLDGRKLIPHWRLNRGINLKKVFEEPTPFDIVLWITGPAAMPYLEDGPVLTREEWRGLIGAFGNNFGNYAIWFN
jgi:hypothetical protein